MQLSQYTNIQYLQRKYNAQQFLKAVVKSWPVGMGTEELAKELLSRVILCMLRMLRAFAMAKGWVNLWMFLAFVKVFRRWVNLWMFFQICEGFLDDGWISEHFWRLSRRWVNFWMFFRFVKVFYKMGQFLNVFQICEGFLKDGSISEQLWRFFRRWSMWGCLNLWMFLAFLNVLWRMGQFLIHLWKFSRWWLNFWMFLKAF